MSNHSELTILVKAASQAHDNPNEIVYCAGVTPEGEWLRLSPVSFRSPVEAMRYKRWDRVKFRAQATEDARPESLRVATHSMEIVGEVPHSKRRSMFDRLVVHSLAEAEARGATLALIRPRELKLTVRRKTPEEIAAEQAAYEQLAGAIATDALKPQKPFPFKFNYNYKTNDGAFEATYQDWEMGETLGNLSKSFGEAKTMSRMMQVYGKDYPNKGVAFVMGRSSASDSWNIHALICMDEVNEALAANLNLTA